MGEVEVRTPIKDKKVKMGGFPAANEMYTPMQSPVIPFGPPGKSFVYAIRRGRNGIKNEVVNTWAECAVLVKDGSGMQYRKFPLGTEHEVIERYFKSGKDDRDEAARIVLERNQYRPKPAVAAEQRPYYGGAATAQLTSASGFGVRGTKLAQVPLSVGPASKVQTQEDRLIAEVNRLKKDLAEARSGGVVAKRAPDRYGSPPCIVDLSRPEPKEANCAMGVPKRNLFLGKKKGKKRREDSEG
jgi:hypothetical protein